MRMGQSAAECGPGARSSWNCRDSAESIPSMMSREHGLCLSGKTLIILSGQTPTPQTNRWWIENDKETVPARESLFVGSRAALARPIHNAVGSLLGSDGWLARLAPLPLPIAVAVAFAFAVTIPVPIPVAVAIPVTVAVTPVMRYEHGN